jgi:hypothetical protein
VPDVAGFPAGGKNRTALLSAQGMPGTWQERACLHVAGPDDREVPAVKRGDPGQPRAPGDGRHGGTGDARRTIKISFRESGRAAGAGALESGGLEPVTAGRPEEGHLSLGSRPRLEEVPDLAQDRRGHQQRAFGMPQEAEACRAGVILDVASSQQPAGRRYRTAAPQRPGSEARISSARPARSGPASDEAKKGRSLSGP